MLVQGSPPPQEREKRAALSRWEEREGRWGRRRETDRRWRDMFVHEEGGREGGGRNAVTRGFGLEQKQGDGRKHIRAATGSRQTSIFTQF